MYDPKNPLQGITPALPQANPDNSAVIQSMTSGKPYAETIAQQANTPFVQSTPQTKQTSVNDTTNPQTTSAIQTPPATSPSAIPDSSTGTPSILNAYGNDMSLANRYNAVADQMKTDREASYPKAALPEPTPSATSNTLTNPFGNSEMGTRIFSSLANQALGKGYSGLAGIGAMTGGMEGLPSGNFGDRAKRNAILNERGQTYMAGLNSGAATKSPFDAGSLRGDNTDAFKPDSLR